jgi:hypothetical protein
MCEFKPDWSFIMIDTGQIATGYRLEHWAGIVRERAESGLTVVENPNARAYYLEESAKGVWSTRQLGCGFTFEARQKRISFDGESYYIDLVCYNYILKCFVLIDLKTGRMTHTKTSDKYRCTSTITRGR